MKYCMAMCAGLIGCCQLLAAEPVIHQFSRTPLTDVYYSEGIGVGDINRDGVADVVHGPFWFEGPEFTRKHAIYPPKPQPREAYADSFFSWVYDFDNDGWNDVLAVGFPGTPAFIYQNPGQDTTSSHWAKHQVLDSVANESPQFVDIAGDDRPELVCTRRGFFGYATINLDQPFQEWPFQVVSERIAPPQFGHGLGVGDVNRDGLSDLLMKDGWFQQPESIDENLPWKFHPVRFAPRGGADIHCYDVDDDGDNDVITSLAAHEFGLAWHEQIDEGRFREHVIMGDRPAHNRYGIVFSELHSVNLADIDGDGLKDIVTGKTYWSHHRQSPMWDAGAVVYWFRLQRNSDGIDWIPYRADSESGIGRQLVVADLNNDSIPDIVAGGMKGAHVLIQSRQNVPQAEWEDRQPRAFDGYQPPAAIVTGPAAPISNLSSRVTGSIEGETMKTLAGSGNARSQSMTPFTSDRWSGGSQLFWTGASPGDQLKLTLPVEADDTYQIQAVLTRASDYGVVQLSLDGEPLGPEIDLYGQGVVTTGVLALGRRTLKKGEHELVVTIVGANPSATKTHFFGLDYVLLKPLK